MKTSYIVGVVVLAVVIFLGWMLVSQNKSQVVPITPVSDSSTKDEIKASDSAIMPQDGVREITVDGSNFKFDPSEIKVKKGDKVKITFKNTGGMHNFVIPDFKVTSKTIKTGTEDVVEFSPDKTGTFEFYCSVGNHKAMGMKGSLIVE